MAVLDMKEAAGLAKGYIAELFAPEEITNVGLEEVEFDQATEQLEDNRRLFTPLGPNQKQDGCLFSGLPPRRPVLQNREH